MSDNAETKTPGPLWAWIVGALVFAQIVKRGIIGWQLPEDFTFGGRFVDNLVANLIYGLPVLVVYVVLVKVMNSGQKSESS